VINPLVEECREKVNEREALRRWRRDPTAFIKEVLVDPDTGKSFKLHPAQGQFLCEALTPGADGSLAFPETVYAAPKKSGKTATAA